MSNKLANIYSENKSKSKASSISNFVIITILFTIEALIHRIKQVKTN